MPPHRFASVSPPRPPRMGSDHGLLAICLHANGANVIAVDRAAGPLEVARRNVGSYLRHAKHETESANQLQVYSPRGTVDHAVQESKEGMCGGVPRLECRLGNGLSALEEGEVDTVCIAGVGESISFCKRHKPRELCIAASSLEEDAPGKSLRFERSWAARGSGRTAQRGWGRILHHGPIFLTTWLRSDFRLDFEGFYFFHIGGGR